MPATVKPKPKKKAPSKKSAAVKATDIVVILDRSGSMVSIKNDMDGALTHFLDEQRKVNGDGFLTIAQFDTEYERVCEQLPLTNATVPKIEPRGGTALHDAIGETINWMKGCETKERLVVFVVITDGMENASRKFHRNEVNDLIEAQRKAGWQFVFLGANQDAVLTGETLGIAQNTSLTYAPTSKGSRSAMHSVSASVTLYRMSCGTTPMSFSADDRSKAMSE